MSAGEIADKMEKIASSVQKVSTFFISFSQCRGPEHGFSLCLTAVLLAEPF
jgi:hypothetical protein